MMQDAKHLAEVDTTAFGRSNPFLSSSEVPHSDPPPYESVVMHDGGVCLLASEFYIVAPVLQFALTFLREHAWAGSCRDMHSYVS